MNDILQLCRKIREIKRVLISEKIKNKKNLHYYLSPNHLGKFIFLILLLINILHLIKNKNMPLQSS